MADIYSELSMCQASANCLGYYVQYLTQLCETGTMNIYNLQRKEVSETLSNLSKDAQPSLRAQI